MDAFRRDPDPTGDADIEAAEMETLMNDILCPSTPLPADDRPCEKTSRRDSTVSTAASTAAVSRQGSLSSANTPSGSTNQSGRDGESQGGPVVDKALRKGSCGRRRSSVATGQGSKRGSKGIVERINGGVKAIGAEGGRRRLSLLGKPANTAGAMEGAAAGAAAMGATDAATPAAHSSAGLTGSVAPSTGAEPTSQARAARQAALTHVGARSKVHVAKDDDNSYDVDADQEADEQARERGLSKWNLEFHDPILEEVSGSNSGCPARLRQMGQYLSGIGHEVDPVAA